MGSDSVEQRVQVPVFSQEEGIRTSWPGDGRLSVRVLGDPSGGHEVVIEGNSAGLHGLAQRLLALAQEGVPSGMHLHLEESTVLHAPSVPLVLEREDDVNEFGGI